MEIEEFRDIPGYDGLYQVSNLGNVKSLPRKICNHQGCHISKEKILSPGLSGKYLSVVLSYLIKPKTFKVHSLVAMAFLGYIPNAKNNLVVDHIDNIQNNNRLENLQIVTNRENCSKDARIGTSKYTGVSWCKRRNKWVVRIKINKKYLHLGYFTDEIEASKYYKNALKAIENNEEIVIKKRIFSSNYKGVSWSKNSNKWIAQITVNGKKKHLGHFKTELEASIAYQNKLKEIQNESR